MTSTYERDVQRGIDLYVREGAKRQAATTSYDDELCRDMSHG